MELFIFGNDPSHGTLPIIPHFLAAMSSSRSDNVTKSVRPFVMKEFFCPALTKLALDLHVNFCGSVCLFVCLFVFPVFFFKRLIG